MDAGTADPSLPVAENLIRQQCAIRISLDADSAARKGTQNERAPKNRQNIGEA